MVEVSGMFAKSFKRILLVLCAICLLCTCSCDKIKPKERIVLEHEDLIDTYAPKYGIPRELLAAVIMAESGFDPKARSSAGAIGLMQLMPTTAEEMAGRMGIEYDEYALTDPEYNISMGTYYLAYLYRNLGENWDTALAAYNAGIGNVLKWLEDERYTDDGTTLKEIPFKETKNYVSRVNKYKQKYKDKYYSEGEES